MPNPYFRFKQFAVYHDRCAMKVTTDACLFGAWTADTIFREKLAPEHGWLFDIGTGTGLLSLMVAQKNKGLIHAVEIDTGAAIQAEENISASPWKTRIQVTHIDVLQWDSEKKYDIIFSNPPFYENELRPGSAGKSTAHHDSGLKLEDLFRSIKIHLGEDGTFFLLLPIKRKTEIAALLEKHKLHPEKMVFVQQTIHHQPFRLMLQGRSKPVDSMVESTISIRDNNKYTPEFAGLLQPYYLYL